MKISIFPERNEILMTKKRLRMMMINNNNNTVELLHNIASSSRHTLSILFHCQLPMRFIDV